jgi:formate/nitrite transporter FocA (FNT family)
MTLEMYAGFLIGNLVGVGAVALAIWFKRKKGQVETDERTALIRAQAGATAFYLSLVAVYLAWAAENVINSMNGEAIRLFSPLGIVFCVMLAIWGAAYFFQNRQFSSAGGEQSEAERKKLLQTGAVLAGAGVCFSGLYFTLGDQGNAEAQALVIALQGVLVSMGLALIIKARQKKVAN